MVALSCDLLETYQPIVLVNSGGYIPAVHGRSGFAGDSDSVEIDGSSSRRTGAQALGGDSWHLSDGPLCVGRKASNIAVW